MKKKTIYLSIFLPVLLFTKLNSMEQYYCNQDKCDNLILPNEIIITILEQNIKDIISKNNVFEPFKNIKDFLNTIKLVNWQFYNLSKCLINFTKKQASQTFSHEYIHLIEQDKNKSLINMIKDVYCQKTELEAAKLIISGVSPNLIVDQENNNILLSILANSRFNNLVKLLLKYGVNINAQNNSGLTALMIAAKNIDNDLVNVFLQHKDININLHDNSKWNALMLAIYNNNKDIALKLLSHKDIDVNAKTTLNSTALIIACRNNHTSIVKALLNKKDIDANVKNNNGDSAIGWAVFHNNKKVIKLLLKHNNLSGIMYSFTKNLLKVYSLS